VATAANAHDSTVVADLLHGSETRVYGDSAHTGPMRCGIGPAWLPKIQASTRSRRTVPYAKAPRRASRAVLQAAGAWERTGPTSLR
jgi:hypothetical protein